MSMYSWITVGCSLCHCFSVCVFACKYLLLTQGRWQKSGRAVGEGTGGLGARDVLRRPASTTVA